MATRTKSAPKADPPCGGLVEPMPPAKQEAWVGFHRAHSAVTRALDAELTAKFGLQLSAFEVLSRAAYSEDGYLRMSDLAEKATLSPSRISRLVSDLEARGLMERRTCETDTRVVYAEITERGRELVGEAQETHVRAIESLFFAELSAGDIKRLAELWPRVIAAAGSPGRGSDSR